jgi:membrane associated rhomboid family serine protease
MLIVPLGDDFDNREFPFVGVLLVSANVIVAAYCLRMAYDARTAAAGQRAITEFICHWGLVPAALAHGKYLGLLTHMFLHGGLMHLLGNMFCFWAFMHTLEYSLGAIRFLVLYLLWGLAGGLMHAAVHWGSDVPLVGASGAIAGMIGAYWVAFGSFTKIRTAVFFGLSCTRFSVPASVYIVFWIGMQLLGIALAENKAQGVAWYAHFGGFAAGCITMAFYKGRIHQRLVVDGGYIGLRDDPPKRPRRRPAEPEAQTPPGICPYCKHSLEEASRLADNLLRCGNPDCARCIYLEEAAVG